MKRIGLAVLMLLVEIIGAAVAQDSTDTAGWPVEERCVGEPTAPPEGWAWEGIIFTHDYPVIRALNPAFETPYIIIFDNLFITASSLSPDGKWYAVPKGYTEYANSSSQNYNVEELMVYSTDGRRETYRVEYGHTYWYVSSGSWLEPIKWIDNSHIVFPYLSETGSGFSIINPFTSEIEFVDAKIAQYPSYAFVSPDLTRAFRWTQLSDSERQRELYDFQTDELVKTLGVETSTQVSTFQTPIQWLADSASFFARRLVFDAEGNFTAAHLTRFNCDGEAVETIFADEADLDYVLSPDERYLAMHNDGGLYIVDLEAKRIQSLCVGVSANAWRQNLYWSPSGEWLAFNVDRAVVVLNPASGEFYEIASGVGTVVGWGAGE